MTPPDALQVISTLAVVDIALGLVLMTLPVGECSDCPHCQRKRTDAAAARLLDTHKAFHSGINRDPSCPHCTEAKR